MSAFDVLVIGGGPAGSTAGRLLAAWGHSVLLLTRARDSTRGLAESLPPSTHKLLAAVGVLDDVATGFRRSTGNTVWWDATEPRVEYFDPERAASGFQVFRPDFDRLLHACAERAGVRLVADAAVPPLTCLPGEEEAQIEYAQQGRRLRATGRFVLDCSGRAGVMARRGLRRHEKGGRMQAFVGVWRRDAGWDLPDDTHTLVETYEDGWSWSVPLSRPVRQVATMVDAATTQVTRGRAISEAYRGELAKTRALSRLTAGATLQQVFACDASLYHAHAYSGPRFLLVGDAGSFIDPLSSFGVKKAMASAWLAAIATHTSLIDPARQGIAFEFFSAQERRMYAEHLRRTREFAAAALGRHPHPFWEMKARLGEEDNAETSRDGPEAGDEEEMLLRAPETRAALELMKQRTCIDLVWAPHVGRESRAIVRGREVVLEPAVRLCGARHAVRFVEGVDVIALGDLAPGHRQVADLYQAYCDAIGEVPLRALLAGLSVLIAGGALVWRHEREAPTRQFRLS